MATKRLSILLGLTTAVTVGASLPVRAATFDFDQLQNISSRPIDSDDRLSLLGEVEQNQGYTAFFNRDRSAPDGGHADISLNASGNGAPYYVTGRQGSPEDPPSGATRTSSVTDIAGFPTLSSFLSSNGISFNSLGVSLGQKSDRAFTETWNLGEDKLGQDWFASPDSTIEERIYTANPNAVEFFLSYGNTKIVDFGYSDLYSVLDYGPTTVVSDDIDLAFGDPVRVKKVAGLNPFEDALATAFLQDVDAAGGGVQLYIDDRNVSDQNIALGNGFFAINLRFVGDLRAVPVPEPTSVIALLMFGTLGAVSYVRQTKRSIQ
ncbi:MAG: hypothetical protein SAK29_04575 [Scytonema sp. PMC 1069.18]|nr:hypothetical protein [Scytonema sp. PMC 1069.18]MEC4885423.1 hypothetical protein [Scytonema sp. PMC 1070.18]